MNKQTTQFILTPTGFLINTNTISCVYTEKNRMTAEKYDIILEITGSEEIINFCETDTKQSADLVIQILYQFLNGKIDERSLNAKLYQIINGVSSPCSPILIVD